jgi:hypothetical protein
MADKKITALTALGAGLTEPANDLLHIIDYSASPVNKKITIANLFNQVNTDTTIIGASKKLEVEHTAGTSVLEVLTNTIVAGSEATVSINKDEHDFIDFAVSSTSGAAISVDASTDDITINADSEAAVDFTINGDTGINFYSDGGLQCVGIGTGTVDGTTTLTVAADATTGHGVSTPGNILMSGVQTLNATGAVSLTQPVTTFAISGAFTHALLAGTEGQIKVLTCITASSGQSTITVTNPAWGGNGTIVLDAVGESATLIYAGSKWNLIGSSGLSAGGSTIA